MKHKYFPLFLSITILILGLLGVSKFGFAIEIEDLLPGDLIVYVNPDQTSSHVAMVDRVDLSGYVYIHHASSSPHHCLTHSVLRTTDDGESYEVYRNHDSALAFAAALRFKKWVHLRIPYDDRGADLLNALEDSKDFGESQKGIERLYGYAQSMSIPNFYRRIKYAARRSHPVYSCDSYNPKAGFQCVMAAILTYQVEELAAYVPNIQSLDIPHFWISDRYADDRFTHALNPSKAYLKYQARLRAPSEYQVPFSKEDVEPSQLKYFPSLVAWDEKRLGSIEDFADQFDTSFPMDAKIVTPSVLRLHLQTDQDHWQPMGLIKPSQLNFTEAERINWRASVQEKKEAARQSHLAFEGSLQSSAEVALGKICQSASNAHKGNYLAFGFTVADSGCDVLKQKRSRSQSLDFSNLELHPFEQALKQRIERILSIYASPTKRATHRSRTPPSSMNASTAVRALPFLHSTTLPDQRPVD